MRAGEVLGQQPSHIHALSDLVLRELRARDSAMCVIVGERFTVPRKRQIGGLAV
jgi:hypothetical protein